MSAKKVSSLIWCLAFAILAYITFDFYQSRNAPLFRRFERQWFQDVIDLEASKKLPPQWSDVGDVEVFGGTPETKEWLKRIEIPTLKKKENGKHKLEVLVVAWEEDGKQGALVQYNLIDSKSQNMIFELGRTLILADPTKNSLSGLIEGLRQ